MAPSKANTVVAAGVVLETALNVAQFVAQFTPIPALGPSLAALAAIIQTCNDIASNRSEVKHLQERCRYLVEALNDPQYVSSRSADSSLVEISARATAHLREVQAVLSVYCNQSRWEVLLKQSRISKDIQACHRKIDDCCKEFDIKLNLQLRHWQEEHSRAYEKDREELSEVLKHLGENEVEILQVTRENKEHIGAILKLLQTELHSSKMDSRAYRDFQASLYSVHKRTGELPPEVDLAAGEARRVGHFAVDGSAAFDIWEGLWLGREKVAMKTLRGIRVSPETRKRFVREIGVWRKIWAQDGGKYILPLYGVCFDDSPFPYMVSPWMHNGTAMSYLRKYPRCDRLELITGIAKGLRFLHGLQPPIAHGHLRGTNILIDDNGNPLLADFGLSKIIEDFSGVPFTQSQGVIDSYRWFAPEMCVPPGFISTFSDVFAFSITAIEIITMRDPYDDIKLTTQVLFQMQQGVRPKRPQDMDDLLWEVCNACWRHTPHERAPITWVVERLEERH